MNFLHKAFAYCKNTLLWILKRFFTILGVIFFLFILAGFISGLSNSTPELPDEMILKLSLERGITDHPSSSFLGSYFGDEPITLLTLIGKLENAKEDKRVKGIWLDLSGAELSFAHAQELRQALQRFKIDDRIIFASTDTFGELSSGNAAYYLASVADEIWLQPSGLLGLVGAAAEVPFLKGTFDKLGIAPRFAKRKDYKTAPNTFTETTLTDAHKEELTDLVNGLNQQLVNDIAKARKLSPSQVKAAINIAPLNAQDALDKGFIDQASYGFKIDQHLQSKTSDKTEVVDLLSYFKQPPEDVEEELNIAVIHAIGEIWRGNGADTDIHSAIFSQHLADLILEVAEDETYEALLIRLNSPGGSYVASDTVWQALNIYKETGKPVIISISDMAASGGYFIAMGGDKIFIQPASITGSIGVFAGKFVAKDLMEKVGLNWETVSAGNNADMFSFAKDFTPDQWQKLQTSMDQIYLDFTSKVVSSRNIPADNIENLAQGKIWLGTDAVKNGLADEIGGYYEAIESIRIALKKSDDALIILHPVPEPVSPVKEILDLLTKRPDLLASQSRILGYLPTSIRLLFDDVAASKTHVLKTPSLRIH